MEDTASVPSRISESNSEKLVKVDEVAHHEAKPVSKKSPPASNQEIKLVDTEFLTLTEDVFGQYWDETGQQHTIKRFTWKNKNKIQVQVINYGARITSMKLPDRKGDVEDIVLGFDDLAGYLFYKKYYVGATIGRFSQTIQNSTFRVDKKQYFLTANQEGRHHNNGGRSGLDQVVWSTFVDDKKIVMSHMSPHLTEGYPGDLFVRITFELSDINEFKIDMEAFSTEPTIINLSNFTYFNLAGHHSGPEEIYKHMLTLNCNCFTPQVNGLTTGDILNVVHSQFDFQVPKVLGKVMGITPKDGFNQNLCVNRASNQDICFVGRVLHPPSGRMVEIYSNQYGVNFSTANEFGYGRILSVQDIISNRQSGKSEELYWKNDPDIKLLEKINAKLVENLLEDEKQNYAGLNDLIAKIKLCTNEITTPMNTPKSSISGRKLRLSDLVFTNEQMDYLKNILEIICDEEDGTCVWLQSVAQKIVNIARLRTNPPTGVQSDAIRNERLSESLPNIQAKKKRRNENSIPSFYRNSDRIVGKERKVYQMHGGIALQTQNYPNSANFKKFPKCVLNPGETYKHTIIYKFWIRAGNPNKWIKRNLNECQPRK